MLRRFFKRIDILLCCLLCVADFVMLYLFRTVPRINTVDQFRSSVFSAILIVIYAGVYSWILGKDMYFGLRGFMKGLFSYGWPVIMFMLIQFLLGYIININAGIPFAAPNSRGLLSALLYRLSWNGREEVVYRGLIFTSLFINRGEDDKAALKAGIYSALMFGVMHIANAIVSGDVAAQIMNAISAACIGFLFAAIIYRSKNLWAVIILHAGYNFMSAEVLNFIFSSANALPNFAKGSHGVMAVIYSIMLFIANITYVFAALRLYFDMPLWALLMRAANRLPSRDTES